ncbi:hypothetical protein [Clostridium neonatale]|uniref:hypothetical protein n=1 Tax=Clostridium neonatale TaxID=137838 RepID=UPI00291C15F6|nr:Helix-turn-helix domain-containing protein [Clostridium neonatale]
MNLTELKIEMLRQNVNHNTLAKALDISKSGLSKKLNGTTDFSRKDIFIVKKTLNLSPKRVDEIFFNDKVDFKSTKLTSD